MLPTRFNCFSSSAEPSWPQILKEWLGHFWSYCHTNLSPLIQRISSAAKTSLEEEIAPVDSKVIKNASVLSSPEPEQMIIHENDVEEDDVEEIDQKKSVDEEPQIDGEPKKVEAWEQLFQSDEKLPEKEKIDEEKKELTADKGNLKTVSSPKNIPIKSQKPSPLNQTPPIPIEEDPILDEDILATEKDKTPLNPKQSKPEDSNKNNPPYRREIRRNRRWKGATRVPLSQFLGQPAPIQKPPANTDPTPVIKPAVKLLDKPSNLQDKNEPMIIECGGGGDCQLHSILKGLEMQHPKLAKYEKNKQMVLYSALDLRQIGVKFAREKYEEARLYAEKNSGKLEMDKISVHAQRILGYLDADRREYNEDEVNAVQNGWEEEKANLEKALMEKKIKSAHYEKQKKAIYLKYVKKTDHLEKNVIVKSDEEFLTRLEKNGFSCSTVHLYALSAQLNVPILVHEKDGIPGHDIQTFNASESKLDPVHLLRVSRGHFKLLLFPNQSA